MTREESGYKKNKINIMTDLALETAELLDYKETDSDEQGVQLKTQEFQVDDKKIKVTWVKIVNEQGAKEMGKPIGNYITVESTAMRENDVSTHEEIIKILSDQLIRLKKKNQPSSALIVGLGNWNVTPDALGPKVIAKTLVTSHIVNTLPDELKNTVMPVSAISPGVMGLTGIETGEIIKGIVDRTKPDLVIAIDALAARSSSRINTTIQLSDTGINPGAGVGNKRMAINEETMGAPVIAIGVPTVVDAATLINDSLDAMLSQMMCEMPAGSPFFDMLNNLESEEKYGLIRNVLDPYSGNMFVTPKEVDAVIDRLSNIIANALNISLHPGIDKEDINRYMY